jgi:hypothetical protein
MITGSVRRAARSGRIRTELVITASECDDHRDPAWVDAAALPRPVPSDLDGPDRPTGRGPRTASTSDHDHIIIPCGQVPLRGAATSRRSAP